MGPWNKITSSQVARFFFFLKSSMCPQRTEGSLGGPGTGVTGSRLATMWTQVFWKSSRRSAKPSLQPPNTTSYLTFVLFWRGTYHVLCGVRGQLAGAIFYHIGPGEPTWVVRLGNKFPYPLSHLSGPNNDSLSNSQMNNFARHLEFFIFFIRTKYCKVGPILLVSILSLQDSPEFTRRKE